MGRSLNRAQRALFGALCAAASLTGCGGGQESEQPDYYPIAVGDSRSYVVELSGADSEQLSSSVTITGTRVVDGVPAYVMNTSSSVLGINSEKLYAKSADAVTYVPQASDGKLANEVGSLTLLRLPLVAGDNFVQVDKTIDYGYHVSGDWMTIAVKSNVEVLGAEGVSVRAGAFADCMHVRTTRRDTIDYSPSGRREVIDVVIDDWYAPRLGLVREDLVRTYATDRGTSRFTESLSLSAYRVGG
jgi:hypothetical protein